jgi:transcriptional regulator with XRE-family HTH domain
MNFSQLHERVRIEVLRRIENGSLNGTMLAHQVGCTAAHISNFLRQRRRLSIESLDKVLRALSLSVPDLYPEGHYVQPPRVRPAAAISFDSVPLIEPVAAASSIRIPSGSIIDLVKVRSGLLGGLRDKCSAERRRWDRFVAVEMWQEEAKLMHPLLPMNTIVLIDRHYNSTFAYAPGRPTIYAVRIANRLRFRLVAQLDRHLVLRTHNPEHVPELLALTNWATTTDVIVGRVFLTIVEH